jgi:Holliday junction resolvase RusA-like endonuclease
VKGTPRGFGNSKVACEWLNELGQALGQYAGAGQGHDKETVRYEVVLEFRIFPESPNYWRQNLPHGTDLDNLVKQTLDGLAETRSTNLPRGLGVLATDSAVYRIVASKEHVLSDDETGVWVTVNVMQG